MPKARHSSYNMSFKLKVVAEAEAVENNSEIAREYGLSESMVRRWCKNQAKLFNVELNKPFKDSIRKKYLAWMISGPFEYTPSGKKKAPTRNLVLRWANEAWQEI